MKALISKIATKIVKICLVMCSFSSLFAVTRVSYTRCRMAKNGEPGSAEVYGNEARPERGPCQASGAHRSRVWLSPPIRYYSQL